MPNPNQVHVDKSFAHVRIPNPQTPLNGYLVNVCFFSFKCKKYKKGHAHDICTFFYLVCNYNYTLEFICYI
jgi:hypothetical protein